MPSCNLYYFLATMILAGADGIVKGLDPVSARLSEPGREGRADLPAQPQRRPRRPREGQRIPRAGLPAEAHRALDEGEARRGRVRLQRADPAGVRAVFLALGRKIRKSSKTTGGAASPSRFCFLLFISAKDEPAAPFTPPPRKRRYNNLTRRAGCRAREICKEKVRDMASKEINMTEGDSFRQMLSFAIPLTAGGVLQQAYSMADAVIADASLAATLSPRFQTAFT